MTDFDQGAPRATTPLSVSALMRAAKALLESEFPRVLVEGEISNLAQPASGHWYFTLKDSGAQIRCAMFRNRNRFVRFPPRDGMQIVVRGSISLYEARGDFQLIAESMEEAGEGALRRAFEELRARLAAEGLFDRERKRPLPPVPAHVGVITSPRGAAIRDVLTVLARRFPAIDVTILPVLVQGEEAAGQIVRALERANRFSDPPFDLLLVTRGGGSLEDLWPFNEERVARAIHASAIPVVSAVGHETDFTIADLVADVRAPTPSAAAEIISPDRAEWLARVGILSGKLQREFGGRLAGWQEKLAWLGRQVRDPRRRLQEQAQRLDDLNGQLLRRTGAILATLQQRTSLARSRLTSPQQRLVQEALRLQNQMLRVRNAMDRAVESRRQGLKAAAQALDTLSPLATLERGYAIVTLADGSGRVVTDAREVNPGERIAARVSRGTLIASVEDRVDDDAK